jgi:hypothetical protein
MATRSLVRFARREDGVSFSEHPEKVIVQVYKHWDGYPSGHPTSLANWLVNKKIVNGLRCLAAQYIAAFKQEPGDLYVESPEHSEHGDIEYITYVWGDYNKGIWMSIFDVYEDKCIFVGKPQELIDKYEE